MPVEMHQRTDAGTHAIRIPARVFDPHPGRIDGHQQREPLAGDIAVGGAIDQHQQVAARSGQRGEVLGARDDKTLPVPVRQRGVARSTRRASRFAAQRRRQALGREDRRQQPAALRLGGALVDEMQRMAVDLQRMAGRQARMACDLVQHQQVEQRILPHDAAAAAADVLACSQIQQPGAGQVLQVVDGQRPALGMVAGAGRKTFVCQQAGLVVGRALAGTEWKMIHVLGPFGR